MKKLIVLFSLFAFSANAQSPQNVLFKISDIVPVKGEDNQTISCEYNITVYNRTDRDIANTTISMTWEDDAVLKTIETEKKINSKSASIFKRGTSRTQDLNKSKASTEVSLDAIPSKKQIVSKQSVATDKCFLLLNNADFSVKKCAFASTEQKEGSSSSCNDLFSFIGTDSPDYYTEFSEESYDANQLKQESRIKKDLEEIEVLYNSAVESSKRLEDAIELLAAPSPVPSEAEGTEKAEENPQAKPE